MPKIQRFPPTSSWNSHTPPGSARPTERFVAKTRTHACSEKLRIAYAVYVFTGSSRGSSPKYETAARNFGQAIARRGLILVYGGAGIGGMKALADGALEAGGEVIGVLPRFLADQELAPPHLTALHLVGSMHERKAMMHELADCFAVLPGGLGTLEEVFEAWTWRQLMFHKKPIGCLDLDGYFRDLFAFLDSAAKEGFVRSDHLGMAIQASEPADLLDRLEAARRSAEAPLD